MSDNKEVISRTVINNLEKNIATVTRQIESIRAVDDFFLPESDRLMILALESEIKIIKFEIEIFKKQLIKPAKKAKKKTVKNKVNSDWDI